MSDDEFWTEFGDRLAVMTTDQLRLLWRLTTFIFMGAIAPHGFDDQARLRLRDAFRAWRED